MFISNQDEFIERGCFHYTLNELRKEIGKEQTLPGYYLRKIDKDLLERAEKEQHVKELGDWISWCWKETEQFFDLGVGYSIIFEKEDQVVCSCITNFVCDNQAEIGVFTNKELQQQSQMSQESNFFTHVSICDSVTFSGSSIILASFFAS